MIKITDIHVDGWAAAIRGMRNPMNSWIKSDSEYDKAGYFHIGEEDLKLMSKLANAGPTHGKFLRMINVTMDITAPLYWWKEYDTYKVGTVANSCSTMHKITAKKFELDDFSHEHIFTEDIMIALLSCLNIWRTKYLETHNKEYWYRIIQILPSSYNQKRTVQLNYAVLRAMVHDRKDHKLDEWRIFCEKVCDTFPYSDELIISKDEERN